MIQWFRFTPTGLSNQAGAIHPMLGAPASPSSTTTNLRALVTMRRPEWSVLVKILFQSDAAGHRRADRIKLRPTTLFDGREAGCLTWPRWRWLVTGPDCRLASEISVSTNNRWSRSCHFRRAEMKVNLSWALGFQVVRDPLRERSASHRASALARATG